MPRVIHDARGMLEVNRDLLRAAARERQQAGESHPLVISAATWGRGCRQEVLQALEPYRREWGFNSSLVAAPPRELAARLLGRPELEAAQPPGPGCFQGLGMAYGAIHTEWLPVEEPEESDLF